MRAPWLLLFFLLAIGPLPARALTLTSKEVIRLSITDSLTAQSTKLDNKIAQENVQLSASQYDTLLTALIQHTQDKTERSTVIFGTESNVTDFNLGLSQLAPSGTLFGVDFINQRQSTNSPFATNPQFFATGGRLSLNQPLLQNGLGYQTRQGLKLAKRQAEATDASVTSRLEDIAYRNVLLYWTWYFYHHLYTIDQEAHTLAQKLYQTNRKKSVVGLIEDNDLYAFAANVNIKNNDLLITAGLRDKAKGEVQAALNLADQNITPGTEGTKRKSLPTAESMIADALTHHPQYLALQKALKAQNIAVAMKKNSRLPLVDLNASLLLNGIDPSYSTALGDIKNVNPLWQTGVSVSFPLQNRGARAQLKKSELVRMQGLLAIKQKESDIVALIRQLNARLMQNAKRLGVTALAVENQRKKWGEEIRKYDQGRSDTDMVIRYQDDYLNARRLQLKSKVDYEHASVELDYTRGRLGINPAP